MLGPRVMSRLITLSSPLFLGLLIACQPTIGDSCGGSRDCSATGERQCDLAQPGGYCTVQNCNADTCPDGAICVEWRFNPSRTAQTWCMRSCNSDGNCRTPNYLCAFPNEITLDGQRLGENCPPLSEDEQLARVIDLEADRSLSAVCAAVTQEPPCPTGEESDTDEF